MVDLKTLERLADQMDKDAEEEGLYRPWIRGSGVTERSLTEKERASLAVAATAVAVPASERGGRPSVGGNRDTIENHIGCRSAT